MTLTRKCGAPLYPIPVGPANRRAWGAALHRWRTREGLALRPAARRLDLDKDKLARLERGVCSSPDVYWKVWARVGEEWE